MLKHENPRHILLPTKDWSPANAQEIERFSRAVNNGPVCVGATGNPGTIASTGALSIVTWTASTNPLQDLYGMLAGSPTTSIRIPMDGYYDFWANFRVGDTPSGNTYLEARFQSAPTSNSGFGAPVFADMGPRMTGFLLSGYTSGLDVPILVRGVEMHKDDLVRCEVRILGSAVNFTSTTVDFAEFRMVYPIPTDK